MAKPLRVLIVEDSEDDALLLVNALKDGGYEPIFERVDTSEGLKSTLSGKEWDCVLSDYSMPQYNGIAALREVQAHGVDIPFILVSGTIGEDTAVGAMKAGAHDYLMKDKLGRLIPALERELAEAEVRRERRQAEEALRRSEEQYRTLIDTLNDGVHELDARGVVTFANDAFARILGFRNAKDVIGRSVFEFEEREGTAEQFMESLSVIAIPGIVESTIRKQDGTIANIEIRPTPVFKDGKLAGVRGIIRDITERKQAEVFRNAIELKRQGAEKRFQDLFQFSPDAILITDSNGIIIMANSRAETTFGYPLEELVGRPVETLVPPKTVLAHVALRKQYLSTAIPRPMGEGLPRLEAVRKDGTLVPVNISLTPLESEEGTLVAASVRDMTEQVKKEQAGKALEAQLRQAQKIEAIGQLAGGVAHDFNNILMAITGYCELLLLKTLPADPLQAFVLEIQKAADRGASLTRQFLAFSRKQILEPRVLNLNDEITKMEGMLRRLIRENIELKLSLNGDLGSVQADPGQIEQVIMNLVINSSDAMPTGGTLTIETSNVTLSEGLQTESGIVQPGNCIMISVKDTGVGMDEAVRAHIFEPFFTTKEQGKGTGLGLATVYGIVKQSKGHVLVESAPGQGTTFIIYLPRWEGQEQPAVIAGSAGAGRLPRGSESVLLVDDNDSIRSAVTAVLVICGYRVLQAANGQEGLEVSRGHTGGIDLVITDVVMPQMGGPELVKQLVANRPGIKVIYMSGYSEEAAALQSNLTLNSAYLPKPASMQTLLQKIRELLDGETGKQP
jgi:PAS domain S-box-containing protein